MNFSFRRLAPGLVFGLLLTAACGFSQPLPAQDLDKDVEALFTSVMSQDPLVAEEAREEILLLGRKAAPIVARHLQDKGAAEKYIACELLGNLGDPSVVPALLDRVKDAELYSRSVRSAAARALGRLGDTKAAAPLIEALKVKEDAELQYEAAVALGALRAAEATEGLTALLPSDAKTYHDRLVAAAAVQALGRIRAEKAIGEIAKLLDKSNHEPGTDLALSYYAARALERISAQNLGSLTTSDEERLETIHKWKDWAAAKLGPKKEEPPKKSENPDKTGGGK